MSQNTVTPSSSASPLPHTPNGSRAHSPDGSRPGAPHPPGVVCRFRPPMAVRWAETPGGENPEVSVTPGVTQAIPRS